MCTIIDSFALRDKIAAFDLDGTIIRTKSGRTFPIDANDWMLICDEVKDIMKQLSKDGYSIVIITNQLGVSKGKTTIEELEIKLKAISEIIGVEIMSFVATNDDEYRKPRTGIWDMIKSMTKISKAFYVGDAAGRPGDFNNTDYKFALNCEIDFATPDRLFLWGEPFDYEFPKFDITFKHPLIDFEYYENDDYEYDFMIGRNTMVIMVGSPASGKSTIANTLDGVVINQDTFGTVAKCKKYAIEAIKEKKNVIIDATNRSVKTRSVWIDLARNNNYRVIVIDIVVTKELVMHLNTYRSLYTIGHIKVPAIAIHTFFKNYERPTQDEGIDNIYTIGFRYKSNDSRLLHYLF